MKHIPRFWVDSQLGINEKIVLTDDQKQHIFAVLRLSIGASVRIFNSQYGEWDAVILDKNTVLCKIKLINPTSENGPILALSIINPNRFGYALEKVTELGVSHIIPVISQFTQYQKINHDKCTKIIIQGCEQSGRLSIPKLENPYSLRAFLEKYNNHEQTILVGENQNAKILLKDCIKENSIFLIGPEGGFSDEEKKLFTQYNSVIPFSFGKSILRSETAAVSFSAFWQGMFGHI